VKGFGAFDAAGGAITGELGVLGVSVVSEAALDKEAVPVTLSRIVGSSVFGAAETAIVVLESAGDFGGPSEAIWSFGRSFLESLDFTDAAGFGASSSCCVGVGVSRPQKVELANGLEIEKP